MVWELIVGPLVKFSQIKTEPFKRFCNAYKEAIKDSLQPNSMVLSTSGKRNFPDSRVVLLKEVSDEGFIFFSNYNSKKGEDISFNNQASILFWWESIEKQVRISGLIERIPESDSIEYFNTRSKLSRIAAYTSNQSTKIESYEELQQIYKKNIERFKSEEILKPKTWGGYILKPQSFEFWSSHPDRLHQRERYDCENNCWNHYYLSP